MTLIDLGTPEDHHPDPPPPPRWLVRLRAHGDRTLTAAVAVLALCAGLLVAAAPPELLPSAYQVGAVPADAMMVISGDTLVWSREFPQPAIEGVLVDGSATRWSAPIEQIAAGRYVYEIRAAGGLILVNAGPRAPDESTVDQQRERERLAATVVAAYDPRTGQRRWQLPGSLIAELPGQLQLVLTTAVAGDKTLSVVDPATGHARWQHPLSAKDQWTTMWPGQGPYADTVLTVDADGQVRSLDPATGVPTVVSRIPAGTLLEFAHDGRLGVVTRADADRTFWLYRMGATAPLWHRRLGSFAPPPSPCEPGLLCFWGDSGVTAVDAETGVQLPAALDRWEDYQRRTEPWQTVEMYGGRHLLTRTTVSAPAWLAVVDPDDPQLRIRLLARAPGPVDRCVVGEVWLVCMDGKTNGDAFSFRRSTLDDAAGPLILR